MYSMMQFTGSSIIEVRHRKSSCEIYVKQLKPNVSSSKFTRMEVSLVTQRSTNFANIWMAGGCFIGLSMLGIEVRISGSEGPVLGTTL